MEDNNKTTSEFENLVKEATGEIPTVEVKEAPSDNEIQIVDDGTTVEVKEEQVVEEKNEETPVEPKEKINVDDIQVVDDNSSVELPQTKEEKESSIPSSVDISTPDSQTIGTIKPDKQKSPIAMLVLFGLLIAFIVFMPTAISLFNQYFGTDLNIDSLKNTQTNNGSDDNNNNDRQEVKMFDLKEDTVVQIGKIDFGGFKKENNEGFKISFYVKNNGTVLHKFDKKLYLEYYDDSNTFVGRTFLENIKEVSGGVTNNYSIAIDNAINNRATKIEVVQRTEDDYPAVNLTTDQLTCTSETNDIVYKFDNNSKLTEIKDIYTYVKDDDVMKYNNDLITYKSNVAKLDALDGVTAVITETESGFMATTAIDYQFADYSKLSSNTNYYVKETYAKTISFEMNAKGFTCR